MNNDNQRPADRGGFWKEGLAIPQVAPSAARLARALVNAYLFVVNGLVTVISKLRRRRQPCADTRLTILAVGPFYYGNWTAAFLEPLAQAHAVGKVLVITPDPHQPIEHVDYVTPPVWMSRLVGMPVARALQALATAWRLRPELIIGYHLPWNGIVALLVGRLIGARTAYFSVGGPAEIVGGGLYSEHALFSRQGRENQRAERGLLKLVERFDDILTMGTGAERYLQHSGVQTPIWPISVGVNVDRFNIGGYAADETRKSNDLITISRLAKIKRVDVFLKVIAEIAASRPHVRAIILGDGDERASLETMIDRLGLAQQVQIIRWIDDLRPILRQSRLFIMTSASEGLPLSLIEAMLSGLPVVVPRVGELSDLVRDDENGFLISPGDAIGAARKVAWLLDQDTRQNAFGTAARRAALRYSVTECTRRWDTFLAGDSG